LTPSQTAWQPMLAEVTAAN